MTAAKRRTRPQTDITARRYARNTGAITGPSNVITPVLADYGIPWMYDRPTKSFLVNVKRLDDVLVALELAGQVVQVELAGWSA